MATTLQEVLSEIPAEALSGYAEVYAAAEAVNGAVTMPERWAALRKLYSVLDTTEYQGYPGGVDWVRIFTPIEYLVWQDIRYYGVPLWPQYPACGVFFDFACPHKKIAVEADGKNWHDEGEDAARDERVKAEGWQVYRVPGRDCYRSEVPILEMIEAGEDHDETGRFEHEFRRYKFESSTALISAIKVFYYDGQSDLLTPDDAADVLRSACLVGGPSDPKLEGFD